KFVKCFSPSFNTYSSPSYSASHCGTWWGCFAVRLVPKNPAPAVVAPARWYRRNPKNNKLHQSRYSSPFYARSAELSGSLVKFVSMISQNRQGDFPKSAGRFPKIGREIFQNRQGDFQK